MDLLECCAFLDKGAVPFSEIRISSGQLGLLEQLLGAHGRELSDLVLREERAMRANQTTSQQEW